MKKSIILLTLFLVVVAMNSFSQETTANEKFGKAINAGVGIGYYGYVGHSLPVGTINYEIDIARNFTLAPFAGIYSYKDYYYWGDPNMPSGDPSYHLYTYRETAVPIGVKGSYYFDQLFHAGPKWDFYAGASAGFIIRTYHWESGYYGDKHAYQDASPLYLDAHVGAEYHMNKNLGLFLDLSTGVSTCGLAVHF